MSATGNFLEEVLQAKGNATFEELTDTLKNLETKISQLKLCVVQSLHSTFVLYETDLDRVVQWFTELVEVKDRLDEIESQLEKDRVTLQVTNQDLNGVMLDLEQCRESISLLKTFVDVVSGLEKVGSTDYFHASQLIKSAGEELAVAIRCIDPTLDDHIWIKQLRARYSDFIVDVYDKCRKEWGAIFKFDKNSLQINPHAAKISHVVQSLKNIKSFTRIWEKFLNLLWLELFKPACSKDYRIQIKSMESDSDPTADLLGNSFDTTVNSEDHLGRTAIVAEKLKKPYANSQILFQNLTELIKIIGATFFNCEEEIYSFTQIISAKINDELSNNFLRTLILQNCAGNVEKARLEVQGMKDFVENLRENYNFSFVEGSVFEEIENNFDSYFQGEVRRNLLATVRDLIRSDPHNTVEINLESVPNSALPSSEITLLRKSPASFPVKVVSKSIYDAYTMLKDYLHTYPKDHDIACGVFNLFLALVRIPKNEADVEDLVPLTSVLIHNNSLFLAHHASFTFSRCTAFVSDLRAKASQAISFMMRSVRMKLNDLITTAMSSIEERVDRNIDITTDFLVITAELKRLDSVMSKALPALVWSDILATLVDHTVNELCSKVLAWDDIPANSASELAAAFTQFAVATSSLFKGNATTPREVEALTARAVKKWQRFRLITFVLTASMKEIESKWVQGCGPLANDFTAEEVRKLVRALFQNTDRRAAFLSTIK